MAEKKWANKAWDDAKEGSLTKLGWPNSGKLVAAARKNRKKVVSKLLLIANGSSGSSSAHAKAIIARIKRELGES